MRLLIVSNRLPITIIEEGGSLNFKESVGGLVSGLKSYLNSFKLSSSSKPITDYAWLGWPGTTVKQRKRNELKTRIQSELHSYPVFISERIMDKFYLGFCNRTIWPLFHYFTSNVSYDEDFWVSYKQVNELFCEEITRIIKPDDIVWIHDYHLMLLPKLIRDRVPDIPIGFFLHIPFPSFEVFRLIPSNWRKEILEGLLGADVIGFHTHDYTQYFLRCVLRVLGREHNMGQVIVDGRIVRAETFPMGIEFKKFNEAASLAEVQNEKAELQNILTDSKVILSIDRLDYTKGILNRLHGYEIFLERNPHWSEKVVLILIVVPSRDKVEQYQQMKKQIDELVGRINGKFGSIRWTPILYHYKFIPFSKLIALYNASDVALITPLRDGMNLIAKEFIAAKADGKGVLVLSEMAGASKEVREAIIINPNDVNEIANALNDALEMPDEEKVRNIRIMQARLKRHDVINWADTFIQTLISLKDEERSLNYKLLCPSSKEQLLKDFKKSEHRLLLLDYDGTLVKLEKYPYLAKPTDDVLMIIKLLSEDPKNEVVLISGRDRITLQSWFGTLNIGLVAEHGVWIRKKMDDWRMLKQLNNDWKPKILPILETYADRLPGSFVEDKESSLAWHYRMADPEMASIVAKELTDDLVTFTANIGVQILQGSKVVEVRNPGMSKGDAGSNWISENHFDFILAIGDDWTDEDLFKILPESAYSIRVGLTQSSARYNLYGQEDVLNLIQELIR